MITLPHQGAVRTPHRALALSPTMSGVIWGALLGTIPLLNYFFRPAYRFSSLYELVDDNVLIVSALSTLALLAAAGFSFVTASIFSIDYRRQKFSAALFFGIALFGLLSSMTSNAPGVPIVISTQILAFSMAINFGTIDNWRPIFAAYCATLSVMFAAADLLALLSHDYTWGRLGGHAGPNYWGLTSGSALMLCLLLRPAAIRIPIILIALATLYLAQARGSMMGALLGATSMAAIKLMRTSALRSALWIAIAAAALAVVGVGFGELIANHILLLHDASRGVASGGSGRELVWAETMNLILEHPLFGVGLHQSSRYLHAAAGAHNAYLATTAEQGLVGLAFYLALLVGGWARAAYKALNAPSAEHLVLVGFLGFFVGVDFFEAYALQTGNPFSLTVMIVMALAWRVDGRTAPTFPLGNGVPNGRMRHEERTA